MQIKRLPWWSISRNDAIQDYIGAKWCKCNVNVNKVKWCSVNQFGDKLVISFGALEMTLHYINERDQINIFCAYS